MEEDRQSVQVYAGIDGVKYGVVFFCHPPAAGNCGDSEAMRGGGKTSAVCGGTGGDNHPRGISGATEGDSARGRAGLCPGSYVCLPTYRGETKAIWR